MRGLKARLKITQALLKECLSYNPRTGEFRWIKPGPRRTMGFRVGYFDSHGYRRFEFMGYTAPASIWAVFYMTGRWPEDEVDHKDLDRSNDRWSNLREATDAQNHMNRRVQRNNHSGLKGVGRQTRGGRWTARVTVDGQTTWLGTFDTPEEASAAYAGAAAELHGRFGRLQ
jgi:hypothetical protein